MRILFSLYILLLGVILPNAFACAADINAVRIGYHDDKVRVVIDVSEPMKFKAFTLEGPDRLVVDLPKFQWKAPVSIRQDKKSIIKSVRHGILDNETSRIVFDLSEKSNIIKSFSLPKVDGKSDRIVIDVRAGGEGVKGAPTVKKSPKYTEKAEPKSVAAKPSAKKIIVIDPGHGGKDPGAVNGRVYEKNLVLALGHKLRAALESSGRYKVFMTRSDDRFIKLHNRVKFARRKKADLFISLHADSLRKKHIRGASVYTLSEKASDAQTARLAARENKADLIDGIDLTHEDSDVADILLDLVQRDTMNQSNFLAETLVKKFKQDGIRMLENPHRSAGFAVLKAPDVPSILIEAGFVSNYSDAKLLQKSSHQKKIAKSIVKAVDAYLK